MSLPTCSVSVRTSSALYKRKHGCPHGQGSKSDTRASNLTKDIKKGMGQLAGALTNIRNGSDIFPHEESTLLTDTTGQR